MGTTLQAGTTLGPYVVGSEVGRGGMGAVYRARRVQDGAEVALKVMLAGPGATDAQRERFRREAELAARLNHPAIVRVHDAGWVGSMGFIAMDLIDGAPLTEHAGKLPPLQVARLIAQAARAVEHAHAHGVIHRDLKPDNVLVRRDDGQALVTDFGLARELESATLTKTGALIGTPTYLAPEQAGGGKATEASDVHALGAILFEALTGLPPFRRDDLPSLLSAITNERPERPSALARDVPRALDRVCLAALAKSPAERPSAGALAAALEAIAEGRTAPPRTVPVLVGVGVATLAAAVVAVAVVLAPERTRTPASAPAPAPADVPGAPAVSPAPPIAPSATSTEPWTEPDWLRQLEAHPDLATLEAVHDALDRAPPVDREARARVVAVVDALAGRWTPPRGEDRVAAFDLLLYAHWLWLRVDPAHQVGEPHREQLYGHAIDGAAWERGPRSMARFGRATAALHPERSLGCWFYAAATRGDPWRGRDGEVLRRGVEIAARIGEVGPWRTIAPEYLAWLTDVAAEEPARVVGARAALLDLARKAAAVGELDPVASAQILAQVSDLAEPKEARAFLVRAEALDARSIHLNLARARRLARDGSLEAAGREAERAFDALLGVGPNVDPEELALCAAAVADLWLRHGSRGRAVGTLNRALTVATQAHAGLAMRRAMLSMKDEGPEVMATCLGDLVARLTRELEDRRAAGGTTGHLEAALADVRAASQPPLTPARVEGRLRRWAAPAQLRLLDP